MSQLNELNRTLRLGKAKRAQQATVAMLGTLRFAQPTAEDAFHA
jgi:hypothetical protein